MILILKTGTSFTTIKNSYGDFDDWVKDKMHLKNEDCYVHPIGDYQTLPPKLNYSGIIITGSHAMVTEVKPKGSEICNWLLEAQDNTIPILGICYGHQLLSVLAEGIVEYNPIGIQIGTQKTALTDSGKIDKLLGEFPCEFEVYKAHKQCVTKLPKSAEILAISDSGIIDAFRLHATTWGVQFHPEFDQNISKAYIHEQKNNIIAEGLNPLELSNNVIDVDYGTKILKRFKQITLNN